MSILIKKIWGDEIAELTDRIKRFKSTDKSSSKYFVFKCSNKLSNKLQRDSRSRTEIVDRLLGKPIYLLQFDKEKNSHFLYSVTKNKLKHSLENDLIKEIRHIDLSEVIYNTKGDCLLNAPNNVHFITPSDKHTTRFLRLTDAIYSFNALDRISFWLQPYVAKSSAVLIDTWSLSTIVTHTLHRLKLDIPFNCFHEHISKSETRALVVLNKLSRRINSDKPVLAIVGISSSGSFFRKLPSLLKRSNIPNELKTLSIYGFKNTPSDVDLLARLKIKIKWFEEEDCKYCESEDRKTTYQIDPKYYYPRKYSEKPVRFSTSLLKSSDKNADSSGVKFIKKYGKSSGVLVVHKDDQNDGIVPRHHAFDIDVSKLLLIKEFKTELISTIKKIEENGRVPDVIVSPPHQAAEKIINIVKQRWTNSKYIFSHNLGDVSNDDIEYLTQAKHICIIDDGVISGSRIEGYLRTLRENLGSSTLNELKLVSWFPLILRTPSETLINRLKDSLSGHDSYWKNELFYIYKVFLPDWSGDGECPWCIERNLLDKYVGPLWSEPEWYRKRNYLLSQTHKGITENSLFVEPFSSHKTLGAGSPLAEEGSSELQVLFLLAAGLQVLRNKKNEALGKDDLLYKYSLYLKGNNIDPKCGTFERFSEPLIQSCFLRTVKLNEWSRNIWSKERYFFEDKIVAGKSNELIGETLLFYLRHNRKVKMNKSTIKKIRSLANDEAIKLLLSEFEEY